MKKFQIGPTHPSQPTLTWKRSIELAQALRLSTTQCNYSKLFCLIVMRNFHSAGTQIKSERLKVVKDTRVLKAILAQLFNMHGKSFMQKF